ncbi:MAG: hypothetical protein NVS2B14_21090 [Chamaesiphon sp.]
MSWSDWLYLGAGIGLGAGGRWLFRRRQPVVPPAPPVATQDVLSLLQQLEASQLAYQMAHEMSQFKAGFLARTAHELRSPLNSLINLHQLILSDLCDDPEEEREFVTQAHESALKLLKLIDEVLAVARTEHGTNQLEIQPIQLADVLEEVYQLTHLLAANRNFRFQVSPTDPETYVLADPRWLRQILVNLIEMSISQMEEGSIYLSVKSTPATELTSIWLDVQLDVSAWSEPVELLRSLTASQSVNHYPALSPGLKLILSQTLLELMRGRMEVLPVPTPADESPVTRIQLSIPLVTPEVFLGQEG